MIKVRMTEYKSKPKNGRPKDWRETWEVSINDEPVGLFIRDPMLVKSMDRPEGQEEKINSFILALGGLTPTRHRSRTAAMGYIVENVESIRPDLMDVDLTKELSG